MFGLPLTVATLVVAAGAALLAALLTRWGILSGRRPLRAWPWIAAVAAGALSALLCLDLQLLAGQFTVEVRPTPFWQDFRSVYHALLIALLVAATCTDLDDYVIPDLITVPGMLLGVGLATLSGDLQMTHIWVDWNEAIPQIRGPYLPAWLSTHPHLHGLGWSVTGLATGMLLTQAVRLVARFVMGMEALGFGDVMLMGMIGSFLGWQPTLVAFLIAPLCALTIGLATKLAGGKSYIPYGPYLAAGALIVVFGWRWIWMFEFRLSEAAGPDDREGIFAIRRLFGDWLSLLALAGIMLFGLILLLGLGRLYRMIPVRSRRSAEPDKQGQ
jgi:leader peptidase (prepilin peptidase) / N-methyltransferase